MTWRSLIAGALLHEHLLMLRRVSVKNATWHLSMYRGYCGQTDADIFHEGSSLIRECQPFMLAKSAPSTMSHDTD